MFYEVMNVEALQDGELSPVMQLPPASNADSGEARCCPSDPIRIRTGCRSREFSGELGFVPV